MMDTKKMKKKFVNKKGVLLLSQILTIILVFAIYIIADYIRLGGEASFITDAMYWLSTSIGLVLIVALMVVVRSMRKAKKVGENNGIQDNLLTIDCVRRVVLSNAYSEQLQAKIDSENEINKYETFINKITNKINRLQAWGFLLPQAKREKKLKRLEQLLETPKEEVLKMNFRYKKITQTSLFAGLDGKITTLNRFDTSTHENKDVAQMISYKALVTYILTGITGTFAVDFFFSGWTALWGTFIKLFALMLAIVSSIQQADNFVTYNISQALDNRLRIISEFVNSNEEIKAKVISKKTEMLKDNNIKNEDENLKKI